MDSSSRLRRRLVPLGLVVAVGLAGCSGSDDASQDTAAVEVEPGAPEANDAAAGGQPGDDEVMAAAGEADEAGGEADEAGPDESGPDLDATVGRDLVYIASVTLSSDDPDVTADDVRARAAEAGGFVSDAQLHRDDLGLLAGSITIRVPSENLDALLSEVSETAADVVAEERTTQDVTGQLTDIDAQLRNLGALEEELLVVLGDAREIGDVDDLVLVFDRVAEVRGQIETLEGRRAGLAGQVALSTLTVYIQPSRMVVAAAEQVPVADRPLPWSPGSEATTAWDSTVTALRSFVDAVIWFVVYGVPVALVWLSPLALLALLAVWWRRRRSEAAGPTGEMTPPPVPPAVPDPSAASDVATDAAQGSGEAAAGFDGAVAPREDVNV